MCELYDYYWREYTGAIPVDAVSGGYDVNGRTTYIGQAYIKQWGIFPVTIYPGKKSVLAPIRGICEIDNHIKVMCSSTTQNFKWIPANAADLHVKCINLHLVRGGVENESVLNIGRVVYQNEIVVGKVCGFRVGKALMYFPDANKKKELHTESYEVLICKSNSDAAMPRSNKMTPVREGR
ncbi:hypothetical protein NQ318_008823 [Aromia moschata]|uniref:Uncharacterized protein n=1 Tax=Aromia moschata TaxID=1265417 RepID=A0AAV8ZCT4_9CUCU|nr:hypothetical protein NQ318_008823 [Aromia moschata]